ncbi:hypothetical protein ACS0TY_008050 [Phlomoides rotata]
MEMQAEAERKRRAQVLESEGERQANINITDGKKSSVILASEAAKMDQVNRAQRLLSYCIGCPELEQFRLAYVAPRSRDGGPGDLIDDPKRIAQNYLSRLFIIVFFVVLPLSQIVVLLILRYPIGSGANHVKNLLRLAILVQLVPRIHRILPLVVGSSPSSFVF